MAVENTHTENLVDNDRKFLIDPKTRTIKNASYDKELVQYDSSSEVFTFEMPRYVEGHDMGAAKNVKVYYVNKGASEEIVDSTDVTSTLKITDDGTNTVVFSWTIPANATQHEGTLDFAVTFTCPEVSPDYIWSTKIYSGIVINKGLRNSSEIIKRDPDAFDAILTRVSEAENKVNEVETKLESIQVKENVVFKHTREYGGQIFGWMDILKVTIDDTEYDLTNGYPSGLTYENLREAVISEIKSTGGIMYDYADILNEQHSVRLNDYTTDSNGNIKLYSTYQEISGPGIKAHISKSSVNIINISSDRVYCSNNTFEDFEETVYEKMAIHMKAKESGNAGEGWVDYVEFSNPSGEGYKKYIFTGNGVYPTDVSSGISSCDSFADTIFKAVKNGTSIYLVIPDGSRQYSLSQWYFIQGIYTFYNTGVQFSNDAGTCEAAISLSCSLTLSSDAASGFWSTFSIAPQ